MANDHANLLGVRVDSVSQEDVLMRIDTAISQRGRLLMAHANIHGLNLAYQTPWLKDFYQLADLVYCDGMGVMLGARCLEQRIRERFTLADWIWDLARLSARRRFRVYLLGNPPGVAEKAARILQSNQPDLIISGYRDGSFNKSSTSQENEAVLAEINSLQPDILLVGFGMPLQERWLGENWPRLDVHVGITCGALFEYIAGDLKRGPRWMTDNYLEWLVRLLISPRRYSGRYLWDIPIFFYRVIKQRLYGE